MSIDRSKHEVLLFSFGRPHTVSFVYMSGKGWNGWYIYDSEEEKREREVLQSLGERGNGCECRRERECVCV